MDYRKLKSCLYHVILFILSRPSRRRSVKNYLTVSKNFKFLFIFKYLVKERINCLRDQIWQKAADWFIRVSSNNHLKFKISSREEETIYNITTAALDQFKPGVGKKRATLFHSCVELWARVHIFWFSHKVLNYKNRTSLDKI